VAANIAEGKGRYSNKEFIRFLYIAKGSLNEVITFLIILHMKNWINKEDLERMKYLAIKISKMITALIKILRC